MRKIISFLDNYTFFMILYVALLFVGLIRYYANGCIILGGEGDFVLDFSNHIREEGFIWFPRFGVGIRSLTPSGNSLNIILLCLIEKLTGSAAITNFVLISSIYFFPFLGMYLVCKEMKARPVISFMVALFYVVNPFMLYYLTCINQWNVFAVAVMPMFLWIILRYYQSNFKLFFFFGLVSACFSFAYCNIPLFGIINFSIIFSLLLVSYLRNKKFIFAEIFMKYLRIWVSFVIFNLWWILCFFSGGVASGLIRVPKMDVMNWLSGTVAGHGAVLAKSFSLTTILGSDATYDFFSFWYNTLPARFITLIPFLIIMYFVFMVRDKREIARFRLLLVGTMLAVLFLEKGNSGPLGFIYVLLFKHVPFFFLFKSPVEKFGLLYIFIFSVTLLFILLTVRGHKHYRLVTGMFAFYVFFCCVPFLSGNIIPDYKIGNLGFGSRKYKDMEEYKRLRETINREHYLYRILSLPGCGNYQVCMLNYNQKMYTGLDPVLMNIDKPAIADYYQENVLFKNISLKNYAKLLTIYNIGKIVINKDQIPWFGTFEKESIAELEEIFGGSFVSKRWGSIILYDNQDHFLPRIYVSDKAN